MPSAIYHFDKTGKIIYLNEKGAHQLGYATIEEVLAEKDVFEFRRKLDETFKVLDEWGKPLPTDKNSAAIAFKQANLQKWCLNLSTGKPVHHSGCYRSQHPFTMKG